MTHRMGGTRTLEVGALARVEGEGAMHVKIEDGVVRDVQLAIYEPPRFFEAFLVGRSYTEPPDITARICGICPIAYQASSCNAIESVCGAEIPDSIRALRRLLYCGEWIESHVLHIYMLHAPDFLGFPSAIHLAAKFPEVVERALRMKKLGNDIVEVVGGRAIHPINVRLGGFYRTPSKAELNAFTERLLRARDEALETVRLVSTFEFPDFDGDWELVSLASDGEYPIPEGRRLISDRGLDISIEDYGKHFAETHVAHANALHSHMLERGQYAVGPLARYSLNADKLSPIAKQIAAEVGLGTECRNPFRSIIVRAVELVYAYDEAIRIIDSYEQPERPFVDVQPRAGVGHGCSEAPRGLLYHKYEIDGRGDILSAQIVPPTAQNQPAIESDLEAFVQDRLHLDDHELTHQCEQVIRNYDPCISCATHFLDLHVERS